MREDDIEAVANDRKMELNGRIERGGDFAMLGGGVEATPSSDI